MCFRLILTILFALSAFKAHGATVGAYAAPDASVHTIEVDVREIFDLWVVITDLPNGIHGVELRPEFPPWMRVISTDVYDGCGCDVCCLDPDLRLVFSDCSTDPSYVLIKYTAQYLSLPSGPQVFCLEPVVPSGVHPPAPAYVDCENNIFPLQVLESPWSESGSCTEIHVATVPVDSASFARVKALY